jgi:hypothetical protein
VLTDDRVGAEPAELAHERAAVRAFGVAREEDGAIDCDIADPIDGPKRVVPWDAIGRVGRAEWDRHESPNTPEAKVVLPSNVAAGRLTGSLPDR